MQNEGFFNHQLETFQWILPSETMFGFRPLEIIIFFSFRTDVTDRRRAHCHGSIAMKDKTKLRFN